ncbi:hypothetical protein IC220_03865 [Wolbachia endosymbiont of Pentalonia nigronervosa]|jgi:hypothetical protein|uniref:hypothetical protein n=1 Tax=Wolbachia endosymbiont of Pentalonia nigronervosa TaxID=1301914 RepID=UPI00165F5473|nr:hypothetical protein [Wolbachia endosymbiont of Pentalonia nigronervosa]MBD0391587.1 hypothetical protein [Wolbachia endosymbiont of Pentalonia nigronervosa]
MLSSKNTKNTEELVNPPVVEKDAGTKTEEVKGDVGSQTITKVEALFKVLEDEKFALGNEEEKKRFRAAFEKATDFSSLIHGLSITQVQLCFFLFEYKMVIQYIDENVITSSLEAVKKAGGLIEKYFKGYKDYLAFYEKNDDGLDTLHILLRKHEREHTLVSDILQQEKQIGALRIFHGSNEEVVASRGKKDDINIRNYEFKKGANYDMIITWDVKIKDEKDADQNIKFEMTVGVSHEGIIALRGYKVNGKEVDNLGLKCVLEWTKQNKELYINGLCLCESFKLCFSKNAAEMERSSETLVCNPAPNEVAVNSVQNNAVNSTQSDAATQTVTPKQPDSTPTADSTQNNTAADNPKTALDDIPGVQQHDTAKGKSIAG